VDHFSHIFVDEAGHAVESETIISVAGGQPLSLKCVFTLFANNMYCNKSYSNAIRFLNHYIVSLGVFRTAECRDRAACFGWRSQAVGTNSEVSSCH